MLFVVNVTGKGGNLEKLIKEERNIDQRRKKNLHFVQPRNKQAEEGCLL